MRKQDLQWVRWVVVLLLLFGLILKDPWYEYGIIIALIYIILFLPDHKK